MSKIGIIGAGQMGAGIALVSVINGKEVFLRDVTDEALEKAKKILLIELSKRSMDGLIAKVHFQKNLSGFEKLDFVIEAVFENLNLKHRVISELELVAKENCVIASNTSAIPIADVAAKSKRPQNIVGMHYFSPVGKMPLLEIIRHSGNTEEIVKRAVQLGLDQKKTVIIVKDSPGFYTTRVLSKLMDEAILLLQEGVEIKEIDSCMKNFGFPVGMITLFDEVGIDTAAHVADFLGTQSSLLTEMSRVGLDGRKSGKGFFLYDQQSPEKKINPEALEIIDRYRVNLDGEKLNSETIQMRLVYRFVNEALKCLKDGTLSSPEDGDLGAVMGLGFPPILGGPFKWVEKIGLSVFQDNLSNLEQKFGERFHE